MSLPKTVGVVIPSYNSGKFLAQTVKSVRNQNFTNFHIYVVDDGSAVPPVFGAAPDLTYVRRDNVGVSRTRNYAASLGSEPLLAFIDQDDLWHRDKLARQVAMLDARPDAGGCFTWARSIDGNGTDHGPAYGAYDHDVVGGRAFGGGVILSSLVLRRVAFAEAGGFDPTLRITQDWDLLIRASQVGPILVCRDYLTSYRVHPGNASRDFRRLAVESRILLDRLDLTLEPGDRSELLGARRDFSRLAAGKATSHARSAAREGRLAEACATAFWGRRQSLRARLASGRVRLVKWG